MNVLPLLDRLAYVDHCPVFGEANAASAPLRIVRLDDRIEAVATYGRGAEGPPGHVHGGLLAAAFDGLLGSFAGATGLPAMTGTLTIRYRAPAPLFREFRYEGWFEGEEGRKRFARATLHDGAALIAEAEAVMITVSGTRFRQLQKERDSAL
jgi:acyl-coenzyme A thioesterase PaaI-like protein